MTSTPTSRRSPRPGARGRALGIAVLASLAVTGGCASDQDSTVPAPSVPPASSPAGGSTAAPGATTTPDSIADGSALPGGVVPEGFTTVAAVITDAAGEECEVCLWLADSSDERARGLMGVTDLGDASGMAFVWEASTRGSFYMFQTPTPLSIAWFDDRGTWVGSADMDPCLDTPAGDCPLHAPEDDYVLAVEVFQGDLDRLGIGAGSTIRLLDGSEAPTCPPAT